MRNSNWKSEPPIDDRKGKKAASTALLVIIIGGSLFYLAGNDGPDYLIMGVYNALVISLAFFFGRTRYGTVYTFFYRLFLYFTSPFFLILLWSYLLSYLSLTGTGAVQRLIIQSLAFMAFAIIPFLGTFLMSILLKKSRRNYIRK
ncbi:hypothetical protein E2R51_08795 [Jeotgalibacillus sp. S-D1]|uniref:hypothetical protein n=1 Tax=Jeotgalibacillus sp. S-D1 TaxID=2552189 RepID=UPI001059DF8A|nr:hypothetical protein [Jeotgalibacillus sp. S-D1]TDL32761.1 hypothetical protein E2R51_08795 [Jeotgalibacillus sp. S-D1]